MNRDKSVTVTRDNTVTSQAPRHVTSGVTQRVSHATTTTPHHTTSLVTSSCGWSFGHLIHPSLRAVWPAPGDEKRMGRYAAAAGGEL